MILSLKAKKLNLRAFSVRKDEFSEKSCRKPGASFLKTFKDHFTSVFRTSPVEILSCK